MDSNFSHGQSPGILDHDLTRHFPELLKFESTPEMEASDLWKEMRDEAEGILNAVVVEGFTGPSECDESRTLNEIRALAWNIERGIVFDGILDALQNHTDLKDKDLLLLTELDDGMAFHLHNDKDRSSVAFLRRRTA